MKRKKPNIVLILADDLGWGDLTSYGNLFCKTPYLDRMASEGKIFEQFYVASPVCSPSRAAMLTARFPARDSIHYWMSPLHNAQYGMPDYLDPKVAILPQLIQAAGYRTAHFGKWHLGESPSAPVSIYGFDDVDYVWQGVGPNPGIEPNDPRGTEFLVNRAIRFIEGCIADKLPFYINLWLRDVHAALRPTEEALSRYAHLMSEGKYQTAMQVYYAAVTEMDRQIGRLLDWIDSQEGLAENTLILFSSDNGPEDIYIAHAGHHAVGLPGPFRGRKRSIYEGGIRVPLIARWKGAIQPDTMDQKSVLCAVDLLPTFSRLLGIPLPEGHVLDGEDVTDALIDNSIYKRRKPLMWEWRFDGVGQCLNRSPMLAIRDGDWKLLMNPDRSRLELYNIPDQPMELHSCADDHPDLIQGLDAKLLAWHRKLPPGPVTDRPGWDSYPGYPENEGRGPLMNREEYDNLIRPIKVFITEQDVLND